MANQEIKTTSATPIPVTVVSGEPTLAQKIDAKHRMKTDWDTPKDTWENVHVPKENVLGEPHDTMSINNHVFEPGQTYLVPPKIAETLKERLSTYNRGIRRRLMPNRDFEAERAVDRFSHNVGGQRIDPTASY